MKKKEMWIPVLAAALAAALTASCSFETGSKSGSLSLNFARVGSGSADQARVWVYLSNVLIPNTAGGTDYYAASLTDGSGSVTIEELPPGSAYRIVVVVGTAAGDSLTDVSRYGSSAAFTVNAGTDTTVSLGLKGMTVEKALGGENVKSVVVYNASGTKVSAATASSIFTGSTIAFGTEALVEAGHAINSLSVALSKSGTADTLLVNGTNGVTENGVDDIGTWDGGTAPNVLQSGGFIPGGEDQPVYFYQAAKEFGGLIATGENQWVSIKLDMPGISGRPILDFFVSDGGVIDGDIFGFFATRVVGALRMSSSFIDQPEDFDYLGAILGKDPSLSFFENEAAWGKNLPTVQAFGYAGDTTKTLYVGTRNGVYQTKAAFGTAALSGAAALVPGTRGLDITKIATNPSGAAFMAASDVVVLRNGLVYRLPFIKSLVGTVNDIAWNGDDLLVAGSAGLIRLDTAAAAFN